MSEKGFVPFQSADVTFLGLETGQTSITPTPVQVLAAESARGQVILYNTTTNITIYYSAQTNVSTVSGFPLQPQTFTPPLKYTGDVYAMVQTTTSSLGWMILR